MVSADDIRTVDQLLVARAACGIVAGERGLGRSIRKAFSDDAPVEIGVKAYDTGVTLLLDLGPFAQNLLHRAVGQHVIGIDAGVQLGMNIGIGRVVGRVHAAVFLIDVLDVKAVAAALPAAYQLCGIVCGAVVYDQPEKVLAALAAKALVGARQGMRPVVGRGEDSQNDFVAIHVFSQRLHRIFAATQLRLKRHTLPAE